MEKAKQTISATADATQNIKKSKHKRSTEDLNSSSAQSTEQQKEFDIPTISEISSTTGVNSLTEVGKTTSLVSGNREKDLAELAEIQKKIYAAKKQLRQIGELDDDDEDFLNLRDEDSREEFNEAGDLVRKSSISPVINASKQKEKSPIVFEREKEKTKLYANNDESEKDNDSVLATKRKRFTPPPSTSATANISNNSTNKEDNVEARNEKRPVHERLGAKSSSSVRESARSSQPLARERRKNLQEQELYVPAYRRKEMERDREKVVDRSKEREKERYQHRERAKERDRERDLEKSKESDGNSNATRGRPRVRRSFEELDKRRSASENYPEERNSSQVGKISTTTPSTTNRTRSSNSKEASPEVSAGRKRIGSRVIVAPVKPVEMSDEEDVNDKPVNSVIKIKPRPPVSPSKQAPKNLLLRAVAEAQRSTILKKPSGSTKTKVSLRLGDKVSSHRNTKLYSKSYRDRLKTSSGVGALFARSTKNIIVEVNGNALSEKTKYNTSSTSFVHDDEEYIPESVSDRGESDQDYVYVPQAIHSHQQTTDDEMHQNLDEPSNDEDDNQDALQKTQFVVTLNGEHYNYFHLIHFIFWF